MLGGAVVGFGGGAEPVGEGVVAVGVVVGAGGALDAVGAGVEVDTGAELGTGGLTLHAGEPPPGAPA